MIRCLPARTKIALFFFFAITVFVACKKVDDTVIGENILPSSDNLALNETDTLSLLTYTVKDDTVRADERQVSPIGSMNDPVFGKTTSSVFVQLRLPENNLDFSTAKVDSIVLTLKYKGKTSYCGNLTTPQTIKVYELSQPLPYDSVFYSNRTFPYNQPEIGSWTGTFALSDSVIFQQGSKIKRLPPQLRIPISSSAFINKIKSAGTNFSSSELFLQYIKGLAIIPQNGPQGSGDGALVNLELVSAYSNLTIYYNDSLSKDLVINANSARVNNTQNDYTGTVLANQLGQKQNRDTCYAQSIGGVSTFIKVSNLYNLSKNNNGRPVAILKGELSIPTYAINNTTDYAFPLQLIVFESDSLGKKIVVQSVPFGKYNNSKTEVKFILTSYLQNLMNEYVKTGQDRNYGFFVVPNYDFSGMERIVFNTSKTGPIRPKLKLIYTVIP